MSRRADFFAGAFPEDPLADPDGPVGAAVAASPSCPVDAALLSPTGGAGPSGEEEAAIPAGTESAIVAHPQLCGCAACAAFLEGGEASEGLVAQAVGATAYLDAVLADPEVYRWNQDDPLGTPVVLTYSFMDVLPSYHSAAEWRDFRTFTAAQETAARQVLDLLAKVCNITFQEVSDAGQGGQIRFGRADVSARAFAHYPESGGARSGDVCVSTRYDENLDTQPGEFGFYVLLHEIGHALGLKHTFSQPALPEAEENHQYSVMSYTLHPYSLGYVIAGSGYQSYDVQSQTPMIYDIGALQYLYGANMATATGNDVYSWATNEQFIETIWDAGGRDTIDFSNQVRSATIDLTPGSFSSLGPDPFTGLSPAARGELSATGRVYGIDNLAIAIDVVIENAIGGSGNDSLIGNAEANALTGGAGGDTLLGGVGGDTLTGGPGNDHIEGGAQTDRAVYLGPRDGYTILTDGGFATVSGGEGTDTLLGVELIDFSDTTVEIATYVPPSIALTLEGGTAAEGGLAQLGTLFFTLRLSGPAADPVTVTYGTVGGTASAGFEYSPITSAGVVIPAGVTAVEVPVGIIGDVDVELDETIRLRLLSVTGSDEVGFGDTLEATGIIEDDDFVEVSVSDLTVTEGTATVRFVIALSAPRFDGTRVSWSISDQSARLDEDFGGSRSGSVFIAPGLTTAEVAVTILNDEVIEDDETFRFNLTGATGGDGLTIGTQNSALATVIDDDVGTVSLFGSTVDEGDAGTTTASLSVQLSGPAASPIFVTLSSAGGTATAGADYAPLDGRVVTIQAGETGASLDVAIAGDVLSEGDETLLVSIASISNARVSVAPGFGTAAIEIVNDDGGIVTVAGTVVEEGETATIEVGFPGPLAQVTEIRYRLLAGSAAAGSDFVAIEDGVVTVAAGATGFSLPLATVGDSVAEDAESFTIEILGSDNPLLLIDLVASRATIGILDDDDASVAIQDLSAAEDAGEALVPITLSVAAATEVIVAYRTHQGSARSNGDFVPLDEGEATIPAGQLTGVLPVSLVADGIYEADESFLVEILAVTAPPWVQVTTPVLARVTIANDDPLTGEGGLAYDSDTIRLGTPADDAIDAASGSDLIYGAEGDDTALGEGGDDLLVGAEGDDLLIGGAGIDLIAGWAGDDAMFGGAGDDVILADEGVDTVEAGAGNDRVHVTAEAAFADGGEGVLDVLLPVGAGPWHFDLNDPIDQNHAASGPALRGFEAVDLALAEGGGTVSGAEHDGFGAILFGSFFDDSLVGSSAADILLGQAGADTLIGGDGDDSIVADRGDDTVSLGGGADRIFVPGGGVEGAVTIADFVPGEDRLLLPAGLGADADAVLALFVPTDGGARLDMAPGRSILLVGIDTADITSGDIGLVA